MSIEEPNKPTDDDLNATGASPTAAGQVAVEAEVDDDPSEVVPVESKPLSRASGVSTDAEVAAKKAAEPQGPVDMDWYILKVQSNRERSIADALKRKVAIEGLEKYVDVDNILVPTEKVTEFQGGKKKVVERMLYPG